MSFVYPEFLYALIAIAIPIIIHLFNFRKFKKVYFSNVSFLKEVQQETQSTLNLKHLLVLLSRILAITFMVLAFAQPFIPAEKNALAAAENLVGIYVDNSFSMECLGEEGSLLDEAKNRAIEIVNTYGVTDKFLLLTDDLKREGQRLLSKEDAIDKIEGLTISSKSRMLSMVHSKGTTILNSSEDKNRWFYLISDFQETTTDIAEMEEDSLVSNYFVIVKPNKTSNLFIDSCWFRSPIHSPFQQEEVFVRIKNYSEDDLENVALKLYINEKMVVPSTFSVGANEEATVSLNYRNPTSGIQQGKIEIRDYPVVMDDAFYFSYDISSHIDVLTISEEDYPTALEAVFSIDSTFRFSNSNIKRLNYSLVGENDFVLLNGISKVNSGLGNAVKEFVNEGGYLLIVPNREIDYDSYKEFMLALGINYYLGIDTSNTRLSKLNFDHSIYNTVFDNRPQSKLDLPEVYTHYKLANNSTSFSEDILNLQNGDPFLREYKIGKGSIYVSTVGLDGTFSGFMDHALFVPTLYNMGLLSRKRHPLYHTIGEPSVIQLDASNKKGVYRLKKENFEVIPKLKTEDGISTIYMGERVVEAGNYVLKNESIEIGAAYNYQRKESILNYFDAKKIEEQLSQRSINGRIISTENANVKRFIGDSIVGKRYWKICIILALLFLIAEIILLKLFR